MSTCILMPSKPACQEADVGDDDPGLGAGDGLFKVLGEPPAASEPREGPLDDLTTGQQLEAFDRVGPLDDLNGPRTDCAEPAPQLFAAVAAIGKDVVQPGVAVPDGVPDGVQHGRRTVAVLNIGAMDHEADHQAERVGQDVALAAVDLLAGIEAADTPAFGRLDTLSCRSRPRWGSPRGPPDHAPRRRGGD